MKVGLSQLPLGNAIPRSASQSLSSMSQDFKGDAPGSTCPDQTCLSESSSAAAYSRLDFTIDRGIGLISGAALGTLVGACVGKAALGAVLGGLSGSVAFPLARECGLFG